MEAGAGGVIIHPNKENEIQYAWGLGSLTNNQVEYLALSEGLELVINKGIKRMALLGDLMIVIRQVLKLKSEI